MGAWGYGLFESDDDYDMVANLSDEAGLTALAASLKKNTAKENTAPVRDADKASSSDGESHEDDFEHSLSIYGGHNRSPAVDAVVRDHLNAGKLQELADKYLAKFFAPDPNEYYPPSYILCILGACAMSLGCTLPAVFKAQLKVLYPTSLRLRQAQGQMKKALYGPDGFENGTPYDMQSVGLFEATAAEPPSNAGHGGIVSLNVQGQLGLFGPPPVKKDVMAQVTRRMESINEENDPPYDICGDCGKSEAESGRKLLSCVRCKARRYCGRECQKAHWKAVHKDFCKAPEGTGADGERAG
ncbi:hypothetical protein B0A55_06096 [Friedmanniomyces simplex]|uniref:MYND-type domain-containing protein n=1 Tax=Friedmanniomyces simplex TaxID=329884 RepID=A0A4U0XLP3_9PEZI|nr:hypothetical protein B0A55_06096 [Friedmanniomyces simplex]